MSTVLTLNLNGRERTDAVADNVLLLDYLRETAGLSGTKTCCDGGECGACTVLLVDQPVLSCLCLAQTCAGRRIETVEALAEGSRLTPVQQGFHEKLGAQCGFCTPGLVMAAEGLLRRNPSPTEDQIRAALDSNICRCTGYVKIIEAVQWAAENMAEARHPA